MEPSRVDAWRAFVDLENQDASWSGPPRGRQREQSASMAWATTAPPPSARPPKRLAAVKMLLERAAKNDGHDDDDDDESEYDDESGDEDDYDDAENEPEARPKRRRGAGGDAAPAPRESQKLTRLEKRRAAEAKMPRTDAKILPELELRLARLAKVAKVEVGPLFWKYRGDGEEPAVAAVLVLRDVYEAACVELSVAEGAERSHAERLARSYYKDTDDAEEASLLAALKKVERSLRAGAVKDANEKPGEKFQYSLPLGAGKSRRLKVAGWARDVSVLARAGTEPLTEAEHWLRLAADDEDDASPSNLLDVNCARIRTPDGTERVAQTIERLALSVLAQEGFTRDQFQSRDEAVAAGLDKLRAAWLAVHKSNRRRAVATSSTPSTPRLRVAVWVPHRSSYPARPRRRRVHRTHRLMCAQVVRHHP